MADGVIIYATLQARSIRPSMSVNIPVSAISATFEAGEDKDSSSTTSEEDNRDLEIFDDWIEEERPCKSLFEDKVLPSAVECIKYDKETHGFDVLVVSTKLGAPAATGLVTKCDA